jgi:hypothetical protein
VGEIDNAIAELSHAHTMVKAYEDVMEALQTWALALPGRMIHEGERWGTDRLDRAAKRIAVTAGGVDESKLWQALVRCRSEAEKARKGTEVYSSVHE